MRFFLPSLLLAACVSAAPGSPTGTTGGTPSSPTAGTPAGTPTGTGAGTPSTGATTCLASGPLAPLAVPSLGAWTIEVTPPDPSHRFYVATGLGLADDGGVCLSSNAGVGFDGTVAYLTRVGPSGVVDWTRELPAEVTAGAAGATAGGCFVATAPGPYATGQAPGVLRVSASGAVDTGFAVDPTLLGTGVIDIAGAADGGAVLLVGDASGGRVLRVLADGCLDTGFGSGGQVALPTQVDCSWTQACEQGRVAILDDGGVMASLGFPAELVRLDATGAIDTGYGVAGTVTTSGAFLVRSADLAPDGTATVVGHDADPRTWIASFTSSGAVDLGPLAVAPAEPIEGLDVVVDHTGALVFSGRYRSTVSTGMPVVARTDRAGVLDLGFGAGGLALHAPATPSTASFSRVELAANDTVVAGGIHAGSGVLVVQAATLP